MDDPALYPLRFAPLFKSAVWGGDQLRDWLGVPGGGDGPTAEAWVLSDQGDNHSRVSEGPLAGRSLRELIERRGAQLLGHAAAPGQRFPLLLKFLDAKLALSVQVHPDDEQAARLTDLPAEQCFGKTEAWVVLRAEPDSLLYAGLRDGVDRDSFGRALRDGSAAGQMHTVAPRPGDCVFIPAGTVHALGAGVMLFEVQQTSDLTYRLHDWGRLDARTGRPRELHVDVGLECTAFDRGPCDPVVPEVVDSGSARLESLVACDQFSLWRWRSDGRPFRAGRAGTCRVAVTLEGTGSLLHRGRSYSLRPGDVILLPAAVGACEVRPDGPLTLLECGLPAARSAGKMGLAA